MTSEHLPRRSALGLLGAGIALTGMPGVAAAATGRRGDLDSALREIMGRPEFARTRWGMQFRLTGATEPIYSRNPADGFKPASAVKIFVSGTAFTSLGHDRRFTTRIHRTGPVSGGVLRGDLVLVAGGDLLIGGRLRRDGSLALPSPDHSYYGNEITRKAPGDPLTIFRDLAGEVRDRGIREVDGRVLVDASLFRQGAERIASGNVLMPISPMMVNDGLIDLPVLPGRRVGDRAKVRPSPHTRYLTVDNQVTTVAAHATPARLAITADVRNPDGSHTITLTGEVPLGTERFIAYYVPDPVTFARIALTEVLRDKGVRITCERQAATGHRRPVCEHVSPPLSEQVKPMMKVSSNPHTATFPYLVGALAGNDPETPKEAGLRIHEEVLAQAGLPPVPPGVAEGQYTAEYYLQYLDHMVRQPFFPQYRDALPILGRDGTLSNIQTDSPAAGRVHAKTGSGGGGGTALAALAGYIRLRDERMVTFAVLSDMPDAELDGVPIHDVALHAIGEMCTAVYVSFD